MNIFVPPERSGPIIDAYKKMKTGEYGYGTDIRYSIAWSDLYLMYDI